MANAVKKIIIFEEAEIMKVGERTAQGPVSKKNLLVLIRELTPHRQPALIHQNEELSLRNGIILSMEGGVNISSRLDNEVRNQRVYCPF